jgi:amino acid transporter
LALIVVVIFALAGADPILALFTWLSGISAVGVILLMAGTSAAVVGFFRRRPSEENVWQRAIAPALAVVILLALVVLLIDNFDTLLGSEPDSPLRWILPALVLAAAIVGVIWGAILRRTKPEIYEGIGYAATGFTDDTASELEGIDLSTLRRG